MKKIATLLCMAGLTGVAQADTSLIGGDMTVPGNWTAGVPNGNGDPVGTVTGVTGSSAGINQGGTNFSGATITVGGGAILNFVGIGSADIPARGATWIFNDCTLNVDDDIFCDSGSLTFNSGVNASVVDDFQAQATGSITINGGTFTVGDLFGAQSASASLRLNFLGGSVAARAFDFRYRTGDAVLTTIGGSATASTLTTVLMTGGINFLPDWTGMLTIDDYSGNAWETELTTFTSGSDAGWKLDGVQIDSSLFASSFIVSNDGKTLALVPEPTTVALVGWGAAFLFFARRKAGA